MIARSFNVNANLDDGLVSLLFLLFFLAIISRELRRITKVGHLSGQLVGTSLDWHTRAMESKWIQTLLALESLKSDCKLTLKNVKTT